MLEKRGDHFETPQTNSILDMQLLHITSVGLAQKGVFK